MTSIFCRLVEPELSAYIDGELTSFKKHIVTWHLGRCAKCRTEYHSLNSLSSFLHGVPVVHTSPWLFFNRVKGSIAWALVRGRREAKDLSERRLVLPQELIPVITLIFSLPCLAVAFSASGIVLALAAIGLAGASVIEYAEPFQRGVK